MTHTGVRMSAGERRETVLEAAVAEFALRGLAGTSTEDVARRAGISQPYLFRLFPTKKALFLALVERCYQRIEEAFAAAAGDKRLWTLVERVSGLPFDRIVKFFAMGMLMNVAAAMDLPAIDERWTSWCPRQPEMTAPAPSTA